MPNPVDSVETVRNFVRLILHAKRLLSLADAALWVVTSASLAVSMIGHALAQARGLIDKNAVKRVDRLLSNQGCAGLGTVRAVGPPCRRRLRKNQSVNGFLSAVEGLRFLRRGWLYAVREGQTLLRGGNRPKRSL